MKKFFIAAAFAISAFAVNAKDNTNSAEKAVTYRVNESFNKEFAGAEDVQWSTTSNNLLRASFTQEGEKKSAFFDEQGAFILSTTEITKADLPSKLKATITKKYGEVAFTEVISMTSADEQSYFAKIKVNGVEKLLKGDSYGFVKEVSKAIN